MLPAHLKRKHPYCCWARRYMCHRGQVCLSCRSSLYLSGLIVWKFFYQLLKMCWKSSPMIIDLAFPFRFACLRYARASDEPISPMNWLFVIVSLASLSSGILFAFFFFFLPFYFTVLFSLIAGRAEPALSGLVSSWHIVLYRSTSEFLDSVSEITCSFFFFFCDGLTIYLN